MDCDENFGVLGTYSAQLVVAVIESLIRKGYLEKTEGMYPLLAITQKGKSSLRREQAIKEEETDLQSYVALKARDKVFKKSKKAPKAKRESVKKSHLSESDPDGGYGKEFDVETISAKKFVGDTYLETLRLYRSGLSMREIGIERDIKSITVESHFVKLYEDGNIELPELMALTKPDNISLVQKIIREEFVNDTGKLKPIKDRLEELGNSHISYFEIKAGIAMMGKGESV